MTTPIRADVRVRLAAGTTTRDYERRLREMSDVVGAQVVVGDFDLTVRVACDDDAHLRGTMARLRQAGAQDLAAELVVRTLLG
ncbi:Lrp/AsnC ligand binding domain-containing protein [Streptosporangium saharense]|uniref:Lrp/AsnC ligand binding domain-containing protein n=1 Tax=Streptosporangium saharense TaxID=1706840 RepID=UPI003445B54D